jgi:RNA-binding protein
MEELTPKQRALLRSLAHSLQPVTHVGKEGITDAVADTVEGALRTRELMKVKVLDTAPQDVRATGANLAKRIDGLHVVQTIGRTIVLYRRHPEEPQIKLPK